MPRRENKATVSDQTMEDAFRQGFDEGMRQAAGAELMYEFVATFDGTDLRRVQFSDLDQCLVEAKELLLHGHGTKVTILAIAVPTQQAQEQRAVEEAPDDDVEDAEVVEDEPSPGE